MAEPLGIDAIRGALAGIADFNPDDPGDARRYLEAWSMVGLRVPKLLIAEVERLQAELAREKAAHAKTCDNFDAVAESVYEERNRLRDELFRLRAENELLAALRDLAEGRAAERDRLAETVARQAPLVAAVRDMVAEWKSNPPPPTHHVAEQLIAAIADEVAA